LAISAAGSQTANKFLATPNGASGAVVLRDIVAADVPTLNQDTTGSAAKVGGITVTGTPSIGNVLTATSSTAADWQASGGGATLTSWADPAGTGGGTAVGIASANQIVCNTMQLPVSVQASAITVVVGNAGTSGHTYDFGIYNSSGTLVADTGAQTNGFPGTSKRSIALAGGLTAFAAGNYLACLTGTAVDATLYQGAATILMPVVNGASSTSSTGGVLPSTITPPTPSYTQTGNAWVIMLHQ